ncbi:MAG: glycosyltransferase family 4 protein [Armatimonadetes bacterium]|nr:glycosyltransferase family 4 protein [Armatimonadota bacterium]
MLTRNTPRVLHVCPIGLTLRAKVRPVIDVLLEHGYEVEAACSYDEDAAWMQEQGYTVHRVPIPRTLKAPLRSLAAVRELAKIIRRGNYTIVHSHTPAGGLHANFIAKRAGARFLFYSIRGLPYPFEERSGWPVRRALVWTHAKMVSQADLVFAVGRYLKQEVLRTSALPEDRIVVVSGSGVYLEAFTGTPLERERARQEIRAQLGIPVTAPVAVIVTRVVWEKGIGELVWALKLLEDDFPDLHLLIVGWGPAEEGTRALAQRLGVAQRVKITGWQEHSRVPQFLWASDFFVFPSYYREGFPIAPLEAMAAGLPVIASDIPPCREQIRPGENGLLVPVRNAEALAYAMATLLRNPGLGQELVRRAQEMLPRYTVEVSARQHLEAYNQFLASASGWDG